MKLFQIAFLRLGICGVLSLSFVACGTRDYEAPKASSKPEANKGANTAPAPSGNATDTLIVGSIESQAKAAADEAAKPPAGDPKAMALTGEENTSKPGKAIRAISTLVSNFSLGAGNLLSQQVDWVTENTGKLVIGGIGLFMLYKWIKAKRAARHANGDDPLHPTHPGDGDGGPTRDPSGGPAPTSGDPTTGAGGEGDRSDPSGVVTLTRYPDGRIVVRAKVEACKSILPTLVAQTPPTP